jgi:DNA ligase (NAD+)
MTDDIYADDTVKDVETVMNTSIGYKDIKSEIDDLRQIIVHLDNCYHVAGTDCVNPITGDVVTDNEYDALKRRLEQIDPAWDGFKTTFAADDEVIGKKLKHDPPMTSISKCNGTQEEKEVILLKWMEDCIKDVPHKVKGFTPGNLDFILAKKSELFSMSFKHDGIALSIEYENGKLVRAGLRSRTGDDGIDCTAKLKNIANIPQTLPEPWSLIVRGEIETYVKTFEEVNATLSDEDKKTNPRAYTSGAMNRKTAGEMKGMGLSFAGYNILNFDDAPYKTEIERATWAKEVLGINFVKTIPFTFTHLCAFEKVHRELEFMVDGAVISVNNLEDQLELGTHGNRSNSDPKGKIAFKFADEVKEVIVTGIEWQTGRVGSITPVLIFKGIQLEGTTVSRCTAHNLGIIEQNKIGIGSVIAIIKSGKIIPKMKKVIESKGEVIYPLSCPSCGHPTKRVDGNNGSLSLVCDSTTCSAQQVQNLDHYLKRIGVKGIAEKNIAKLCEANLVNEPADFYKLTLDKLKAIGFKDRSATLILARVKMINSPEQEKDSSVLLVLLDKIKDKKITVKMETFIASLGIDGAGRELGRIMAEKYDDFNIVRSLSAAELEAHNGIGPITAQNVFNYFFFNSRQVDDLLEFVKIEVVEKKSGNLDGKKICLSGSLPGGKARWKTLIEDNGGKISSSVSKKTDYLCAGAGSVGKTDKANKLDVKVITTEDLERMI